MSDPHHASGSQSQCHSPPLDYDTKTSQKYPDPAHTRRCFRAPLRNHGLGGIDQAHHPDVGGDATEATHDFRGGWKTHPM